MNDPQQPDIQRLSPDDCIRGFTASPFVAAILIALAFHGLVIGGSYALETFVFSEPPEGEVVADSDGDSDEPNAAADPNTPTPADADTDGDTDDPTSDEQDRINQTNVMQQINEMPADGETPEEPDLGISIEDTNP